MVKGVIMTTHKCKECKKLLNMLEYKNNNGLCNTCKLDVWFKNLMVTDKNYIYGLYHDTD